MIRLALVGAAGRMGQAIRAAAAGQPDLEIVAAVERRENFPADRGVWTDDPAAAVRPGLVVVDFSSASMAVGLARLCSERGVPVVSGTTGLTATDEQAFRDAASQVAVLRASNFSIGIAALRRALRAALGAVPAGWDVEIVERHHRMKADSPSGTARTLVQEVAALRPGSHPRHGREGLVGPRPADEVGVHAVRGGTWVGDHQVLLAGEGEWLELRHVAQDRSAFAHGALLAARFVQAAAPGEYAIEDVLRAVRRWLLARSCKIDASSAIHDSSRPGSERLLWPVLPWPRASAPTRCTTRRSTGACSRRRTCACTTTPRRRAWRGASWRSPRALASSTTGGSGSPGSERSRSCSTRPTTCSSRRTPPPRSSARARAA